MVNGNQKSFEVWTCPNCEAKNKGQRCIVCGTSRPLRQYKSPQYVPERNSKGFQGAYSPKRTPEPPKEEKAFKWLPILIIVEIIVIIAIVIGIFYIGKAFITNHFNESQEISEGSIAETSIEFTEASTYNKDNYGKELNLVTVLDDRGLLTFWGQEKYSRDSVHFVKFVNYLPDKNPEAWDISLLEDGSILAWMNSDTLYVGSRDEIYLNPNSAGMFMNFTELISVDWGDMVDTSRVEIMEGMFSGCRNLTSLDLSHFDTSNVTDMCGMFASLKLDSLDISSFDTSKVETFVAMFQDCENLRALQVSNFNTSSAKNMERMFSSCNKLKTLDLSSWNTSNVTDMSYMFWGDHSLTDLNISSFDTSKAQTMRAMFVGCSELVQIDVSSFDTSNVTHMGEMFYACSRLQELDLSHFNTSKVKSMEWMFKSCTNLTMLNLNNFDTSSVESMEEMFNGCLKLQTLDLSSFSKNTTLSTKDMFLGCNNLRTVYCSNSIISNAYAQNAQGTPDFTIPIIYDSNGGKNAPSTQNGLVYNHEMTITHPNTIPVRDGYIFSGWLYENNTNCEIDQPGATVSWGELYYDNPITYYAQWRKVEGESLKSSNSESSPKNSKWPAVAEFEVWVNTGVGEINIRSGPGTNYPSIGRIQEGNSAVVHEIDSSAGADWGKIDEGWICLDYVTLEKQSPVDYLSLFVGQWSDRVGQRCMMNAEQNGDKLYVELKWSSGASNTTCWEFVCSPVAGDYYVGYQDGVCYTLDSSDGTTNRITHYTNGYGGFQLERGLIYWIDALENQGEKCVFEKIG